MLAWFSPDDLPYINSETRWKHLTKKEFPVFNSHLLLNMLYNMSAHIISMPLDLDHVRMRYIRKNLVGKKNFYQRIYSAGNFDNIYHNYENIKQLENEMEQKKICNINAYKCTKYSISHIISSIFVLNVSTMSKMLTSKIRELKNLAISKIDK